MSDVEVLFLRLAPADIAYVKFILESYEGVGVVRTLDRHSAVIVVLVPPDFIDVAHAILDSLRTEIRFEAIPPPPDAELDWLLQRVWGARR